MEPGLRRATQYRCNRQFGLDVTGSRGSNMDVISPPFRLDHENDLRGIAYLRDWSVNLEASTVFYRPARLTFVIECPAPSPGASPKRMGIVARLAHMCDGAAMPPLGELQEIGKDAIHAFIIESPLFTLPDSEIPF